MGIELFERVVKGGGQLLRADAAPLGGGPDTVSALLLTFDLGRIAVTTEPRTSTLRVEYLESADQAPAGLRDVSEEEPWWRLLGNPVARAWAAGPAHEGSACVQFRADDQNPRVVTLAPRGGGVAVRLETPPT